MPLKLETYIGPLSDWQPAWILKHTNGVILHRMDGDLAVFASVDDAVHYARSAFHECFITFAGDLVTRR